MEEKVEGGNKVKAASHLVQGLTGEAESESSTVNKQLPISKQVY